MMMVNNKMEKRINKYLAFSGERIREQKKVILLHPRRDEAKQSPEKVEALSIYYVFCVSFSETVIQYFVARKEQKVDGTFANILNVEYWCSLFLDS
jgi:hypothetical protein